MTSLVDAESVLAIDIGSLNTRALLFDVVDGQYHFISSATTPTTAGAPFFDISEGVHNGLARLQEITGRRLLNAESSLILPSQADGSGIDRMALTCSAGPDLNVLVMGLLSDVSIQSAQRLAGTVYGRLVETISLNDRRRSDNQIDAILRAQPDIVIIAGGTEKGARSSVNKLVELVSMASKVLPKENRPKVLYCGNSAIAKRVKENLERDTVIIVGPNIRPSVDQEDLTPAQTLLTKIAAKLRVLRTSGLERLTSFSSAPLLPSAYAIGRMMRFSSDLSDLSKATLGVDLGASATTLALASVDSTHLNVFRDLGIGGSLQQALQQMRLEDITRWIPIDIPDAEVRDYLYQKSLFPTQLPMTRETLAIEQAAARQLLRMATQRMYERWPDTELSFERIFASGATLAQAATPLQSLLMLLDGLQPVGVNVMMLDPYGLSQALGAIAGTNTLLPAQVIESGAYTNLATVICPVSDARPGTVVLKMKITYEEGTDTRVEVKQGALVALPVRNGQVAHLEVEPQHGAVLDPCLPRL
ncbi:MAG TPA: glutamate mutase L [Anaerolineaceae bacterium]